MEQDNRADMQQPEPHAEAPAMASPAEQLMLKIFFVPLAAGVCWALAPWFSQNCYQRFFDAWAVDPFSDAARTVSLVIAVLYTMCGAVLTLPWLCRKFPHFVVSGSIFCSVMAMSIVFGLWQLSGINMEHNLEGVMLGAGFFGVFVGGPLALFLRFDDARSSVLAVSIICGVVGMFVMCGLLYDLSQWLGIWLGGMEDMVIGGVLGFGIGVLLSSCLFATPRGDRLFKYLICTTCAGACARVVALAITHMLQK